MNGGRIMPSHGCRLLGLACVLIALNGAALLGQTITLTSPNGGENWSGGSTHNIAWTSSGIAGNVRISISYDGYAPTFWLIMAANAANTGSYAWTVPSVSSTRCVIRIADAASGTPYDVSDGMFTIVIPGGFYFGARSAAGWTAEGPFDESGAGPFSSKYFSTWRNDVTYPYAPGKAPAGDDGSFALGLGTPGGHGITGVSTATYFLRLLSPDLSLLTAWQNVSGYSVQIANCMGPGNFYANLFVTVRDNAQGTDRTFYSGTAVALEHDVYGDNTAVWNSFNFLWSAIPTFPASFQVKRVFINIWGRMIDYTAEGSISLDDVVPMGPMTDVQEEPSVPGDFTLYQNYPNPFNPSTMIRFQIPGFVSQNSGPGTGDQGSSARKPASGTRTVRLSVYDLLGREVAVLVNEQKEPGTYVAEFNAVGLGTGVLFYRLTAGTYSATKKMIMVK
jgi:hypothetical protein